MATMADLELAFYAGGGLTGSLADRRLAYAKAADASVPTKASVTDARQEWWSAGAGDPMRNITDLERRYYLGAVIKFGPGNSVSDLRWERFGGT